MLSDAVAAFLDSATEREFDQPFLAILREEGFENPRLTHGQSEFGKDFVAQKDGEQWVFQSKAGNIGYPDWRDMRGQLDDLRLSNLAGPEFDSSLPRRAVLVTTGRLVGNAPISASEYNQQAAEKEQLTLEIWQRDDLIGKLTGNTNAVLSGSFDGGLHTIVGALDRGELSMGAIDGFARRWDTFPFRKRMGMGVVELALVGNRLKEVDRLDLACHLALHFVRSAWAGGANVEESISAAEVGGEVFDGFAEDLWSRCTAEHLKPDQMIYHSPTPESAFGEWVTYPVRCTRLVELLGLWTLRLRDSRPTLATDISEWLARFIVAQPGARRPISDRYAVSLVPSVLAVNASNPETTQQVLRDVTVWLCDHYEYPRPGLASLVAPPIEEVQRVFGHVYDFIESPRRTESQIAGVLLDLAAQTGNEDLYFDIRNDQLAVRLFPVVLRSKAGGAQFDLESLENRWDVNPAYPDEPSADRVLRIPHIENDVGGAELVGLGRAWDLLATSSALRDRHFPAAIQAFL